MEALLREGVEETGLGVEVLGEEPFALWTLPAPDGGTVEGEVFVCRHMVGEVAMSNEHVEELFSVLRIGDPIEILP